MALTPEERKWAEEQLNDIIDLHDLDYVDTQRIAEVDDVEEETVYFSLKNSGCCGEHDEVITHPTTGKAIRVGCNYGH